VAASLDGEKICGADIVSAVLPVVSGEDAKVSLPLIDEHQPAAVLSFGLAPTACLNVERVAVNLKKDDSPIVADGPDAYFATLPTRAMRDAIEAGGIPAKLSYHAGTFLCNHTMYSVLHYLSETNRSIPAGFIHIPPTPDLGAAEGEGAPSMALEKIREGAVLALENLVSFLSNSE